MFLLRNSSFVGLGRLGKKESCELADMPTCCDSNCYEKTVSGPIGSTAFALQEASMNPAHRPDSRMSMTRPHLQCCAMLGGVWTKPANYPRPFRRGKYWIFLRIYIFKVTNEERLDASSEPTQCLLFETEVFPRARLRFSSSEVFR